MVGITNRRKNPEHIEQVKFVSWVRVFHPELICFAIPNGGDVSQSQRIKLVQEGMLAGIPDVMIMGKDLPVLALEFKRPDGKGRLSQEQEAVHVQMEGVGAQVHTVNSAQEAKDVLKGWMS